MMKGPSSLQKNLLKKFQAKLIDLLKEYKDVLA